MKITITHDGMIAHEYLRFEPGKTYDVESDVGQLLVANGWAENASKEARGEVSEPFNTKNATDEDAERWEREVLAPARERQVVETVHPDTGLVYRRVGEGDPQFLQEPSVPLHEDGHAVNLTVHDSGSGQGSDF